MTNRIRGFPSGPGLMLLTFVVPVLAACGGSSEAPVEVGPALAQVEEALQTLAGAEDAGQLDQLAQQLRETLRDSVLIRMRVGADGQAWTVVGTHARLGPSMGCAFARGSAPPVTTPGGVNVVGSGQVVCDTAEDDPGM